MDVNTVGQNDGMLPLALCAQVAVSSVQKDMDQVCSSLQESAFFPLEAPELKVG